MELIDGSKSKQSIKCIIVHHQCRWPCVSCTVICSLNANHNYKTLSGSAFYDFYNYSLCCHCTYMHVLSCWCHSWCTLLDWCLYCCAAIFPVVINETGHAVILTKFPAFGCIGSCWFATSRYSQWWQFHRNDISLSMMYHKCAHGFIMLGFAAFISWVAISRVANGFLWCVYPYSSELLHWHSCNRKISLVQIKYRKVSNIRRTESQNLNDSHLVLKSSLPNPLKPGVKSRMKM